MIEEGVLCKCEGFGQIIPPSWHSSAPGRFAVLSMFRVQFRLLNQDLKVVIEVCQLEPLSLLSKSVMPEVTWVRLRSWSGATDQCDWAAHSNLEIQVDSLPLLHSSSSFSSTSSSSLRNLALNWISTGLRYSVSQTFLQQALGLRWLYCGGGALGGWTHRELMGWSPTHTHLHSHRHSPDRNAHLPSSGDWIY